MLIYFSLITLVSGRQGVGARWGWLVPGMPDPPGIMIAGRQRWSTVYAGGEGEGKGAAGGESSRGVGYESGRRKNGVEVSRGYFNA